MKALPTLIATLMFGLPAAAPAHAGDWGGLFSFVALTSDYRFQGVSNSDGNMAAQANVHYWRPDGYYAGVFLTQVDFNDPGHTSYEVDYYAGKNFEFDHGQTELKLQLLYTAFPNNRTFGPTYDFLTDEVAIKHKAGKLTFGALAAYTPQGVYRSGELGRIEGTIDYAVRPGLTLKALAGDQRGDRSHDRVYWSLGATQAWKRYAVEVKYVGNDRTRRTCSAFQPKSCDGGLVGTITVNLPPIL